MEFRIVGTPDEIREIANRVIEETGTSGIEMEEVVLPAPQLQALLHKDLRHRKSDRWTMVLSIIGAACGTMALILKLVPLFQ